MSEPRGAYRAKQAAAQGSALERTLETQLVAAGIGGWEREYLFHPTRRWRFDFVFLDHMLAVELEGGTWVNGAHGRGKHYESDCTKYNEAALLGWRVLRFTTDMVYSGLALRYVEMALDRMIEDEEE